MCVSRNLSQPTCTGKEATITFMGKAQLVLHSISNYKTVVHLALYHKNPSGTGQYKTVLNIPPLEMSMIFYIEEASLYISWCLYKGLDPLQPSAICHTTSYTLVSALETCLGAHAQWPLLSHAPPRVISTLDASMLTYPTCTNLGHALVPKACPTLCCCGHRCTP